MTDLEIQNKAALASLNISEKLHHTFGSSTAKHWVNCYGWASITSMLPQQEAGEAADTGTALHAGTLERYVKAKLHELETGEVLEVKYYDIPNWPKDGHLFAEHFWMTIWTRVLEQLLTGKRICIESKLMLFPDQDSGGTGDIVVYYHNDKAQVVCVVGDIKSGRVRVEPSGEQNKFLLAGAYLRAKEKGIEIDVFKSFIYQPSHSEVYTEHTFTKNQILTAIKKYQKAITESRKDNPKFKVGDHCEWCKAQGVCKAYHTHMKKDAAVVLSGSGFPIVETLAEEELVKINALSEDVTSYFKKVKEAIVSKFMHGTAGDYLKQNLKLVQGLGHRAWIDESKAIDTLETFGIRATETQIIGVPEAESRLKASSEVGMKPKDIYNVISSLTLRPKAAIRLVDINHKEPAMAIQPAGSLLSSVEEIPIKEIPRPEGASLAIQDGNSIAFNVI